MPESNGFVSTSLRVLVSIPSGKRRLPVPNINSPETTFLIKVSVCVSSIPARTFHIDQVNFLELAGQDPKVRRFFRSQNGRCGQQPLRDHQVFAERANG
jgi:hypothetical protein